VLWNSCWLLMIMVLVLLECISRSNKLATLRVKDKMLACAIFLLSQTLIFVELKLYTHEIHG